MSRYSWEAVQEAANKILADGLKALTSTPVLAWKEAGDCQFQGNYLVSHKSVPYYVGESKNVQKRVAQHARPKTSTFYKNYFEKSRVGTKPAELNIDDFVVQVMPTKIGRKEIEEFGIVNFPTSLNKFQMGKRPLVSEEVEESLWRAVQDDYEAILMDGAPRIFHCQGYNWFEAIVPRSPGLYCVHDANGKLIYIGETSDISKRYRAHSRDTYFSALRKNIGRTVLGFEFVAPKRFCEADDRLVSDYLRSCEFKSLTVWFGRYELEEHLIQNYQPPLNSKGVGVSVSSRTGRRSRARTKSSNPLRIEIDQETSTRSMVTLHDEIEDILKEYDKEGLKTSEIAKLVNERGRYQKKDGSEVAASQIATRTNKRPHLFERDGSRVRLARRWAP